MSRFDDDNEDDDFGTPGGTDSVIRGLRAEIVRLEAQLDQLAASVREQTEELIAITAQLAELKAADVRLRAAQRARQRRDAKLLLLAWVLVAVSLSLSLLTYLTS